MNRFTRGILIGIGVGFLFAPLSGKETRRVIKERFTEWRDSLPADSPLQQYTRQVSDQVSQTREHLQNYAQQAVAKVKETGNSSAAQAQHVLQDIAQKTRPSSNTYSGRKSDTPLTARVTPESTNAVPRD